MEKSILQYSAGELFPIVQRLTAKYTGQESTSVTYETARQLMEAVLYCIHENETRIIETASETLSTELMGRNSVPTALEAYETGYQLCGQKFIQANELYVEIMLGFNSYGNHACYETVVKGMPAFFQNYDVRFCPQDRILTLDYPVLYDLCEVQGVDAIYQYLTCIHMEQQFLQGLPRGLPEQILSAYQGDYKSLFLNLCSVVLRRVLVCGILQISITEDEFGKDDQRVIAEFILEFGKERAEKKVAEILTRFLDVEYPKQPKLFSYLKLNISDFVAELQLAVENNCLDIFLI